MQTSTNDEKLQSVAQLLTTGVEALTKSNNAIAMALAKKIYGKGTPVDEFCRQNDMKFQGQYNVNALLRQPMSNKNDYTASIYLTMSFRDERGVPHRIKRNTSCSMPADIFDDREALKVAEMIVGRISDMVDPVTKTASNVSVLLGFQLFNETYDKFLEIPLVDVSIHSATFSASSILS